LTEHRACNATAVLCDSRTSAEQPHFDSSAIARRAAEQAFHDRAETLFIIDIERENALIY